MSDDPRPRSGSRWEPADDRPTPSTSPQSAPDVPPTPEPPDRSTAAGHPAGSDDPADGRPVTDAADEPTVVQPAVAALPAPLTIPPEPTTTTSGRRRNRRRTALVAAAVAGLLVLGGAGGFAIGHAAGPGIAGGDRPSGPPGFGDGSARGPNGGGPDGGPGGTDSGGTGGRADGTDTPTGTTGSST